MKYVYTLAAVSVCISRVTTPVTGTALFITGRAIQTMTVTVVHTVVTKGSAITLCHRLIQGWEKKNNMYQRIYHILWNQLKIPLLFRTTLISPIVKLLQVNIFDKLILRNLQKKNIVFTYNLVSCHYSSILKKQYHNNTIIINVGQRSKIKFSAKVFFSVW